MIKYIRLAVFYLSRKKLLFWFAHSTSLILKIFFQEHLGPFNYHPNPIDMTNLTLSREMQNMAERLAENAHDIWAKKKKEELNTCGL